MGVCNLSYMYYVSSPERKVALEMERFKNETNKKELGGSLYPELMYTVIKL